MKAGITGHQNLGSPEDIEWITNALKQEIRNEKVSQGITSLAIGADQLFASVLLSDGLDYVAVIPCSEYEKTFETEHDLTKYRQLKRKAVELIPLPYSKPEEIAFWEAGKKMVHLSDFVVAVWDGFPSHGLGGTGDVVRFCLDEGKRVFHINPKKRVCESLTSTKKKT